MLCGFGHRAGPGVEQLARLVEKEDSDAKRARKSTGGGAAGVAQAGSKRTADDEPAGESKRSRRES